MAGRSAAFERLRGHGKEIVGFALFLIWFYCTFFSCDLIHDGGFIASLLRDSCDGAQPQPQNYGLDKLWMYAAASCALCAACGLLVLARLEADVSETAWRRIAAIAAACAIVGNAIVWQDNWTASWQFAPTVAGGVLCGVGWAALAAAWGTRLARHNEAAIELIVPAAFFLSFAAYVVLLVASPSSVVALVLLSAAVLASARIVSRPLGDLCDEDLGAFAASRAKGSAPSHAAKDAKVPPVAADGALRADACVGEEAEGAGTAREGAAGQRMARDGESQKGGVSEDASRGGASRKSLSCEGAPARSASWGDCAFVAALACACWVQVAFFRMLASPEFMGDRFAHYLVPFSAAALVALAMLLLCMRLARFFNIALVYRWGLPVFVLSYLPLIMDYGNPSWRVAAYALNFVGMFGVQLGMCIGVAKYARRTRACARMLFCAMLFGEGAGIALGSAWGLYSVLSLDMAAITAESFVLVAAMTFVCMSLGFRPGWIIRREGRAGSAFAENVRALGDSGLLDGADDSCDLLGRSASKACALRDAFGLTERETEVAAYLIAGKSRPFIRDELVISLNTVGTHARNIFSKCGVHSQKELINLAYAPKDAGESAR